MCPEITAEDPIGNRRSSDRGVSCWGIPTQDAPSARSGLRRLDSWSPGVIDAGIAGICAFSFVIDPLEQVARLALEDAAHRIQSRQADGLGATVLEYCDVGRRS